MYKSKNETKYLYYIPLINHTILRLFSFCLIFHNPHLISLSSHTDTKIYTHRDIQTQRDTDIRINRHTDVQIYSDVDTETYRYMHIQTERHTDVW